MTTPSTIRNDYHTGTEEHAIIAVRNAMVTDVHAGIIERLPTFGDIRDRTPFYEMFHAGRHPDAIAAVLVSRKEMGVDTW